VISSIKTPKFATVCRKIATTCPPTYLTQDVTVNNSELENQHSSHLC